MSDSQPPQTQLENAAVELMLAIGQLRRRLRADTSPIELNLSQIATLIRLDQNGWMTPSELARAEAMRSQSMGTILANLEERGWVTRRAHHTDGRLVEFGVTDAGAEARRNHRLAKRDWLMAAIAKLDSEEQQTLIAATALIKRLGEG